MEPQSVLAVCAANVCRSPVVAYLVAQSFSAAGAPSAFASAGVTARGGVAVCHTMRSRLAGRPGWSDFAAEHRSVRLNAEQIDAADLILAATAAERGAIALLRPSARTRTFTLLEAVALAEHAVAEGVRGVPLDPAALATVMNDQRGRVAMPTRPWWRRSTAGADLDIPDAHTSRTRHERVLRVIEEASSRWAAAVAALTARA